MDDGFAKLLQFIKIVISLVLLPSTTIAQSDLWESANGHLAGPVATLAVNNSGHIFVGTSGGGVLRSLNNGESWENVGLHERSVRALIQRVSSLLPNDPDVAEFAMLVSRAMEIEEGDVS